jgi:hypothetical protein
VLAFYYNPDESRNVHDAWLRYFLEPTTLPEHR